MLKQQSTFCTADTKDDTILSKRSLLSASSNSIEVFYEGEGGTVSFISHLALEEQATRYVDVFAGTTACGTFIK